MSSNELITAPRPIHVKLADNTTYIATQLDCTECLLSGLDLIISLSAQNEISEKVLGKPILATFNAVEGIRYYSGIVINLSMIGYHQEKQLFLYQIVARDPFALLSFRKQRRIFQNITTKQILEKVFSEAGITSHVMFTFQSGGMMHAYCTQVDETDLVFIQRLMAYEGWHHHAIHSSGKPMVKILDNNQAFESLTEEKISYLQRGQHITSWQTKTMLGIAKLNLSDYIVNSAEIITSGERKSSEQYSPSELNVSLHGWDQENKSEIRDAAKRHMEAIDSSKSIIFSTSHISAISVGKSFQLTDHPLGRINQKYIVTHVVHTIISDESGRNIQYQNRFSCIPASVPFRLPIPSPTIVHSLHTATVTGPKGEEIYSDKTGRIKVQFHWDQNSSQNENSSCWLPVSQTMASKGFGLQFLPRIGDKVLVQYIEGNPNKPVVVGSLYSQTNDIPYSSTQSGIKTRTTPQGNTKQGNELRFEDKKYNESIFIHAEKDLLFEVNNDVISSVKGKKIDTIDKSAQLKVKEEILIECDKTLTAISKQSLFASSDNDIKIEAGTNGKFSAKSKVSLHGETIEILGTNKIVLQVGTSKIEISNSGIQINAPKISIASQGTSELKGTMVNIEGQAKTNIESALVTVKGSAMTEIKAGAMINIQGAITKIN